MKQSVYIFSALVLSVALSIVGNVHGSPADKTVRKPLVIASVKPLEYIVADLAGDLVEIDSILSGSGSPHHYALKSSQVRKINRADLLVWVDPEFEYFLAKIASRKSTNSVFQLTAEVKARQLPHSSFHDSTAVLSEQDAAHFHHEHGDLHVWLDAAYVAEVIRPLNRRLMALLPQHREVLQKNESLLFQRLAETSSGLREMFAHHKQSGFIVFHDAYRHFEEAYGLKRLSSVTEVPDEQVGARTLARIKNDASNSRCLIADITEYTAAQKMANNLGSRLVMVDLLGSQPLMETAADMSLFAAYLRRFSSQFSECFKA